jgi:hypothetical protein
VRCSGRITDPAKTWSFYRGAAGQANGTRGQFLRGSDRFANEQEEGTHADHDHDARMTNERNRLSVWFDEKGFLNHGLT